MTYGNNLFAQYYDSMRYAPSPQLWIEADSWSAATWANKVDGGYDLVVESGHHGAKDGNAIVSTSASTFRYSVSRNVVGTGSFTIEAAAAPDEAMKSDAYGGWLCNQRTAATNQNGAMQMVFSKAGNFSGGGDKLFGGVVRRAGRLGGWNGAILQLGLRRSGEEALVSHGGAAGGAERRGVRLHCERVHPWLSGVAEQEQPVPWEAVFVESVQAHSRLSGNRAQLHTR